jgi:hypothetical protein
VYGILLIPDESRCIGRGFTHDKSGDGVLVGLRAELGAVLRYNTAPWFIGD